MELVTQKDFSKLATDKIAKELSEFKGDRYGQAVKTFVASTLTNFCGQSQRFAQVVFETEATLSDCCAEIMKNCGSHISDIDVYRGAVRYYFPNAEVQFTMTIDASGDIPSADEMAKPRPQPKPRNTPLVPPRCPRPRRRIFPHLKRKSRRNRHRQPRRRNLFRSLKSPKRPARTMG